MKKSIVYPITLYLLSCFNLLAVEDRIILDRNGKELFNLRFFNEGEKIEDEDTKLTSTYSLNLEEKKAILDAGKYWRDILDTSNSSLSILFVRHLMSKMQLRRVR